MQLTLGGVQWVTSAHSEGILVAWSFPASVSFNDFKVT